MPAAGAPNRPRPRRRAALAALLLAGLCVQCCALDGLEAGGVSSQLQLPAFAAARREARSAPLCGEGSCAYKPVCWAHVPKTGGSEMATVLHAVLRQIVQRVGHFCNCNDRCEPLRVVMLRHPLERLWSSYRHQVAILDSDACRASWDQMAALLAPCDAAPASCNATTWEEAHRLAKPCGCCGLPSDPTMTKILDVRNAQHGKLTWGFLRPVKAAQGERARQMAFLANPGVHNVQSQLILSNTTLDVCFEQGVRSEACAARMQADLDSYALIGFSHFHGAFRSALVVLTCTLHLGVHAEECQLGKYNLSAAAPAMHKRTACCWQAGVFTCHAGCPNDEAHPAPARVVEHITPQAQSAAMELNALDIALYERALNMLAPGQHVVRGRLPAEVSVPYASYSLPTDQQL